ncbi:MAG: FKBP-type peptidyl-prolyl cis-trans isomerase [Lachnospiraceae bacterium]|nr:FKBP-type peptidyl-prolyl cis-trans isomerase [Lachnospiraceae bacterium]
MDENFFENGKKEIEKAEEEIVLFSKEKLENVKEDLEQAVEELEDVKEDAVEAAKEKLEAAEEGLEAAEEGLEAAEEELENVKEDIADTADKTANDIVEKKPVKAPEKSKAEKKQSILFFAILAVAILALLALLAAGIFTLSKRMGWFDKKNNENPTELSTEDSSSNATENNSEAESSDVQKVNYSMYLDDEGFIKDVKASDYINLYDYKNISIDYSEIKPDEGDIEEQIESLLSSYEELDKESDKVTELGDKLNIDYVGKVDGVAFEGGDTKGNGAELLLGSHRYIDDFEDQLVGHRIGDNVTVEVTFPADYGKDELNGKDAVFEVVINGIYATPELTDEFVQKNLSQFASTADEYKAYVEDVLADSSKSEYVWNLMKEKSEVKEFPKEFFDNELEIYKNEFENQFNYYDQYYASMYGQHMWDNIYQFFEVEDEAGYNDLLVKTTEDVTKQALIVQAIAENENIKVSTDDYLDYITKIGYDSSSMDTIVENYGKGYVYRTVLYDKIQKYVIENAKVNK